MNVGGLYRHLQHRVGTFILPILAALVNVARIDIGLAGNRCLHKAALGGLLQSIWIGKKINSQLIHYVVGGKQIGLLVPVQLNALSLAVQHVPSVGGHKITVVALHADPQGTVAGILHPAVALHREKSLAHDGKIQRTVGLAGRPLFHRQIQVAYPHSVAGRVLIFRVGVHLGVQEVFKDAAGLLKAVGIDIGHIVRQNIQVLLVANQTGYAVMKRNIHNPSSSFLLFACPPEVSGSRLQGCY